MKKILVGIILLVLPFSLYAGINEDFIKAVERGDKEKVRLLLDQGANVNSTDFYPRRGTALFIATGNGDLEMMLLLLKRGANINAQNRGGSTALMSSLTKDIFGSRVNPAAAKLLIEEGADVNIKSNDGFTALLSAVDIGDLEFVKLLIERKVNVHEKNDLDQTALSRATMRATESSGASQQIYKEIVALLTKAEKNQPRDDYVQRCSAECNVRPRSQQYSCVDGKKFRICENIEKLYRQAAGAGSGSLSADDNKAMLRGICPNAATQKFGRGRVIQFPAPLLTCR